MIRWKISKNNNFYRTFTIHNKTYILCDFMPKKKRKENYLMISNFYNEFPSYMDLISHHRCECCGICEFKPSPRCDNCKLSPNKRYKKYYLKIKRNNQHSCDVTECVICSEKTNKKRC